MKRTIELRNLQYSFGSVIGDKSERLYEFYRAFLPPIIMPNKQLRRVFRISNEQLISKELAVREINLEEKQKQLLGRVKRILNCRATRFVKSIHYRVFVVEFEERLTRERVAFDGQKVSLEARFDDFEVKMAKEKFKLEQRKKDLNLAQNIFQERELQWEREKRREREYVNGCKQELEVGYFSCLYFGCRGPNNIFCKF